MCPLPLPVSKRADQPLGTEHWATQQYRDYTMVHQSNTETVQQCTTAIRADLSISVSLYRPVQWVQSSLCSLCTSPHRTAPHVRRTFLWRAHSPISRSRFATSDKRSDSGTGDCGATVTLHRALGSRTGHRAQGTGHTIRVLCGVVQNVLYKCIVQGIVYDIVLHYCDLHSPAHYCTIVRHTTAP